MWGSVVTEEFDIQIGMIASYKILLDMFEPLNITDIIVTFLRKGGPHHFEVIGIQMFEKEAIAVGQFVNTTDLITACTFSGNYLGDLGAIAFSKFLSDDASLKTVALTNNQITSRGAIAIARALETNKTITHLDLSNNEIGDDGLVALADALISSWSMEFIDLSSCQEFTIQGFEALARIYQGNFMLQEIRINLNYAFQIDLLHLLEIAYTAYTKSQKVSDMYIRDIRIEYQDSGVRPQQISDFEVVTGIKAMKECFKSNGVLKLSSAGAVASIVPQNDDTIGIFEDTLFYEDCPKDVETTTSKKEYVILHLKAAGMIYFVNNSVRWEIYGEQKDVCLPLDNDIHPSKLNISVDPNISPMESSI